MVYLALAMACSASITLVFKISNLKQVSRLGMLSVNYAVCVVMGFLFLNEKQVPVWNNDFRLTLGIGLVNGILYLSCLALNQANVRRNGAILTSTFARLGVMVPTVLSVLLFREKPTVLQIAGLLLVIPAILLMQKQDSHETRRTERPALGMLILLFILGGMTDGMSKVFEQYGTRQMDGWFLLLTFFFAMLLCIGWMVHDRESVGKTELVLGAAVGVPNYLSTLFLLKALTRIDAHVALPTYSVGAILVVVLLGIAVFHEKLERREIIAVCMITAAILLMNI